MEDIKQYEAWDHDCHREHHCGQHREEGTGRGAAAENVRLSGKTYGHCAAPQARMAQATAMMASTRAPR
jgi:hypothetical protein